MNGTAGTECRKSRSYAAWFVIAAFAVYAAFLTRTYYWDGVLFSLNIESVHQGTAPGAVLFHPNHLLYSAFGYVLYTLVVACGGSARAITVLQAANAICGTAAACLVFVLARRLTASAWAAVFSAFLFAFGATWWKFATDADSYIVSVLAITIAILWAIEGRPLVAIAACQVVAMLFHELAAFACVPIVACILLHRDRPLRVRIWRSLLYLVGTGGVTLAIYVVCYRSARPGIAFPSWLLSYAATAQITHSAKQIFAEYPLSYTKLFLGGKLGYLREYFSPATMVSLIVCAGSLITAVYLFRQRRPGAESTSATRDVIVLWAWLIPYAAFLAWFEPSSAFYKLFLWPPLVLLIAFYAGRFQRVHTAMALAFAISAWNFAAYIYPHAHVNADPVLALAETINRELPPNTTIYYAAFSPDDWYLDYFAPGRRWEPLPPSGWSASGSVCLETTALAVIKPQAPPIRRWDLVNSRHNLRLECFRAGSLR